MQYFIRLETKGRIVRIGPVRTFGEYEERQEMSDSELASFSTRFGPTAWNQQQWIRFSANTRLRASV